jgi:acyl-CoA synthetase (AMP-forming)/AMP-acid ligase II
MRGYAEGADEQPVKEGWLRTGDLGSFDSDGYLVITGRLKDVIVRAGENLSPRTIEAVLDRHPAVRSSCVVGVPHIDLGEVPVAFVQLRSGEKVTDVDLKVFARSRLSRIHVPFQVRFIASWPETSVGKIDRQALKDSLVISYVAGND